MDIKINLQINLILMFDISHGNRTHGQGLKGTLIRGGITKIKIWRDIIFKVPIVDIEIKRS